MFEKLLEYQKIDGKILSLKRNLEKDESKVALNKVVSLVKDSQNKLAILESKAKSCLEDYDKCKATFENTYNKLNNLNKIDMSKLSEEEISKNLDEITNLTNTLSGLERTLSMQAENVGAIIKNFEICRNNIVSYKQQYKEIKEKVDSLQSNLTPEIEKLKSQMQSLEKQIDAELLSKYKHLRQDRIFPVLVPFTNNACGGCSMEIPAALMNKLKSKGYLECEHCRRCIYLS